MVTKKIPYASLKEYLFPDQKRKLGMAKRLRKQIDKFGFTDYEMGFVKN